MRILRKIADDLQSNEQLIIERNMRDVAAAERKKVDATLLQRLRLKPAKIRTLVQGIRAIADQDEPLRKASPLPTLGAYLSLSVTCAVHLGGVVGLRASQSCRHVCQDGVFPVQCDCYCMMCLHCNIHPEPSWPYWHAVHVDLLLAFSRLFNTRIERCSRLRPSRDRLRMPHDDRLACFTCLG